MAFGDQAVLLSAFTGIDQAPLSEGGNWANLDSIASDALTRSGNRAKCSASTTGSSYWTPATFGPSVDAYLTIGIMPAPGNNIDLTARIREAGGAGTYDGYRLRMIEGTPDQLVLTRVDSAAVTVLDTLNRDFVAGEKIGIRCAGSKIQGWYWDGSWKLGVEAVDAAYPLAGHVGFHIRGTTGAADDIFAGPATPIDVNVAVNI